MVLKSSLLYNTIFKKILGNSIIIKIIDNEIYND